MKFGHGRGTYHPSVRFSSHSYSPNPHKGSQMHSIIYLVGVVVVILLILSALGLR